MSSVFGNERDERYMELALKQAQKAFSYNEVPVGAVVVSPDGTILSRAHNKVEKLHTQMAHAESLALSRAGKKLGDWRLIDCWLYVTLEPCSMCMSFIKLSRMRGVVFGAHSPLFGYGLDKSRASSLYNGDALQIVEAVLAQDSAQLLKRFFQQKRNARG
jgi:tRNA(adenine34) deaminase